MSQNMLEMISHDRLGYLDARSQSHVRAEEACCSAKYVSRAWTFRRRILVQYLGLGSSVAGRKCVTHYPLRCVVIINSKLMQD